MCVCVSGLCFQERDIEREIVRETERDRVRHVCVCVRPLFGKEKPLIFKNQGTHAHAHTHTHTHTHTHVLKHTRPWNVTGFLANEDQTHMHTHLHT